MKRAKLIGRVVLLGALFVSGCGKKPDAATDDVKPAAATGRDACTLVTQQEVEAAFGSPVLVTREHQGIGRSSCEFIDPAHQEYFVMAIDVYWSRGREEWRLNNMATAGATRVLENAGKGTDVKAIIDQNPLAGLGDQATFSDLMGGQVLKGDTLIGFKFGQLKNPGTHFRPMAEKALSRL